MSMITKNMLVDFNTFDSIDFLRRLNQSSFSNKQPCITSNDGLIVQISSSQPLTTQEIAEMDVISNSLINNNLLTGATLSFSASDVNVNTVGWKALSCATLRRKDFKKIESIVVVVNNIMMANDCELELRCDGFELSNVLIASLSIPITSTTSVYHLNIDKNLFPDRKTGSRTDHFILSLIGRCLSSGSGSCQCKMFRMNIHYENDED